MNVLSIEIYLGGNIKNVIHEIVLDAYKGNEEKSNSLDRNFQCKNHVRVCAYMSSTV